MLRTVEQAAISRLFHFFFHIRTLHLLKMKVRTFLT